MLTIEQTSALTRRITALSVGVAVVLTVIKAAAWWYSDSVSMLASLADSGLDVAASLATFFAVRYAVTPPDREHRYGHGKAEAFASLTQAGLVFASCALVGEEAVSHLLHAKPIAYEVPSLVVMAVSMLLTAGLVWAQSRVLHAARSVAVEGDRMHYAADFASNVISFAGIAVAALLHSPQADALAGLLVAAWLLWGAIGVFRRASGELMDRELSDDARRQVRNLMREDARVLDVHQLRMRASGPYIHIQMHASLEPALSLIEAHQVMVAAEKRVLEAFPAADIIIHPDPRGAAEPHGGAFGESAETHRAAAQVR